MANQLIITEETGETTKAKYQEALVLENRFYNTKLFLTLQIKSNKLYNFYIDVVLKDKQDNFKYLKTDLTDVEDLDRIDLKIKGEDLVNKTLIISAEYQKIDPHGLVLKDNKLENDITLELSYDLEAGYEQVIDEFKVKGLFPKSVTESIYTEIDFK